MQTRNPITGSRGGGRHRLLCVAIALLLLWLPAAAAADDTTRPDTADRNSDTPTATMDPAAIDPAATDDADTPAAEADQPPRKDVLGDQGDISLDDTPLLDRIFAPDDHVLFVGDEVTQQMFHTRAVAAGIMAVRPHHRLRFYNGGRDGSTTKDCLNWIDEVIRLSRANVVLVSFGLNDARGSGHDREKAEAHGKHLAELIEKIKAHRTVRVVIVVSPPPVASQRVRPGEPLGPNRTLQLLSTKAREVALQADVGFINVFEYMYEVYISTNADGGAAMTLGGRIPTEESHIIMASVMLKALGVDERDLGATGWSPLAPRRMFWVRNALALKMTPPDIETAATSSYIYEAMRKHDEAFFRAWRIAPRSPSAQPQEQLLERASLAWAEVQAMVEEAYGEMVRPTETPSRSDR